MAMNDYFCVLPFFGYEFLIEDGGTHCCLLPRNYNIDELRGSILNRERSKFCSACWNLEDAGLLSDRKLKNSALDFYWDKDIRFIEEQVREGKYSTIMVKSMTSNICNSTCVTCNTGASSAWGALKKKSGTIPIIKNYLQTQEIVDQKLDYSNLVTLNFVGGEPLYEKLNFYIIEKLIEHGNLNCFIQITTNGSVALTSYQKDLMSKFKNINFNVSIDGTDKVFEYMRYPLNWNLLLSNLDFFRTITDNVSASYTTSNLNVLYHEDTVKWLEKQNLPYHYNPVITPSYFRPAALPEKVKKDILAKFGKTKDLLFFIGDKHTQKDDEDFEKMLTEIKFQDNLKKIKINDYLPEFCELINFL